MESGLLEIVNKQNNI